MLITWKNLFIVLCHIHNRFEQFESRINVLFRLCVFCGFGGNAFSGTKTENKCQKILLFKNKKLKWQNVEKMDKIFKKNVFGRRSRYRTAGLISVYEVFTSIFGGHPSDPENAMF